MMGSIDASQWIIVAALLLSSMLNIAYLIPVAARAFYVSPAQISPAQGGSPKFDIQEAPLYCVVPLCITAAGCVALFLFGDALYQMVQLIPLRK